MMLTKDDLFDTGDSEKIWDKYCGFLDLSMEDFLRMQETLLMDQIELINGSTIAKKFMPQKPGSVQQFRDQVPLTTYEDYADYLDEKDDEVLPVKPDYWVCTSGRGGKFKWIPWTSRTVEAFARCGIAAAILSCANRKGEVNIKSGMRALHNLAPPPYGSGILSQAMVERMGMLLMPSFDEYANEDFASRTQLGFKMGLRYGVDMLSSLTSVLIKMGERFVDGSSQMKFSWRMLQPNILRRLVFAMARSRLQKRQLLPKDLWPMKGLIAYGMDTGIYRQQLKYYWGKEPLEIYAATESGTIATQAWNKNYMTCIPFSSFREFIPEEEWRKSRDDADYQPRTVLINELEPDKMYEVVVTSFYGMPFLRYRIGDLIRVVALEDVEAGIKLPQIAFESRADGIVDLGSFARLDEKTVWRAIADTGIKYEDWSARKEYEKEHAVVRIYIELKEDIRAEDLGQMIHKNLISADQSYQDMETMLGLMPLRVEILPVGSFQRYYEGQLQAGADLAHLKPPHMNAPDGAIERLMGLEKSARV